MSLEELGEGKLRLSVGGELDLATAEELDRRLGELLSTPQEVLLDLGDLTFMDSTGLASIIAAVHLAEETGAVLEIAAPLPPQPQRLLELTGVIDRLSFTQAAPNELG